MESVDQGSSRPSHFLHQNQHTHLLSHLHYPDSPSWNTKPESPIQNMSQCKDSTSSHEDSMPSTSDFVKKLYKYVRSPSPSVSVFIFLNRMLEDPAFQNVVSWGPQGDCFVVKVCPISPFDLCAAFNASPSYSKDMNEFTKSILPRMFKHSNFASFVRQLNKYDFHKVKNTDENQYGEHVCNSPYSL